MAKITHTLVALVVASSCFSYYLDAAPAVPSGQDYLAPVVSQGQDNLASTLPGAGSFNCELCKVVSSLLELYLERDSSEEAIEELIGEICFLLKIEDKRVCDAAMVEFKVGCGFSC